MSENIINVDGKNFKEEVLNSEIPVVLDFWAEWCGPCKMIAPILEESAKTFDGKIKFVKVNIDTDSELAANYGIRGIPTLLLFENGDLKARQIGALQKKELERFIFNHIEGI